MVTKATLVRLPGYRNTGGSGCTNVYAYYGGSIVQYFKAPQSAAYWGSWIPRWIVQCQLYEILIGESVSDTLQRLWDGIAVGLFVGDYGYTAFGEGLQSAYLTHPKSAGRTPPSTMTLAESLDPAVGPGTFTGQTATCNVTWWDGTSPYPDGIHGSLTNPPDNYFAQGVAHTLLVGTFIFDPQTGLWTVNSGLTSLSSLNATYTGMYGTLCTGNVQSFIPFIQD